MEPDQDRLAHALDVGWECMKLYRQPTTFLWLASNGWNDGYELQARRHDDANVAVSIKPWENLLLVTKVNWN